MTLLHDLPHFGDLIAVTARDRAPGLELRVKRTLAGRGLGITTSWTISGEIVPHDSDLATRWAGCTHVILWPTNTMVFQDWKSHKPSRLP